MIKNIRAKKVYKQMDSYTACSLVEGFADHEATQEEAQAAWQWLLDTGTCWHLQGWYGRNASDLLERGLLLAPLKDRKDYYGNTVPGVATS